MAILKRPGKDNKDSAPSETAAPAGGTAASSADAEQERIRSLANHVFITDNDVLAYDENTLVFERKKKHTDYELDSSTVITYDCEDGLRGSREVAIWKPDSGLFGGKKTHAYSMYKIDNSLGFSKKENDRYFHLFHDLRTCLNDKIIFFSPEEEYLDIELDHTDRVLRAFDGKKAQFARYADIIGVDLDTNIRIMATQKQHVGRALVTGSGVSDNGAIGSQSSKHSSTVESYDIVIYLNDENFSAIKKHYNVSDGDMAQKLFRFLEKLVQNNSTAFDTAATIIDAAPPRQTISASETAHSIPAPSAPAASATEVISDSELDAAIEEAIQEALLDD